MKNNKDKKQLIIFIFLIASFMNLLSFFSFNKSIRNQMIEQFRKELKHYTTHKAQDVKLILDDMIDSLEETQKIIREYSDFEEETIRKILTISNKLNYFNFTSFAYPNGDGIDSASQKFNITNRNYFQKSMKGEIGISGLLSSKVENKKPVQIISIPVYNKDDIISGVLFGVFDFGTIEKLSNTKRKKSERNKTYLLQLDGSYITKPNYKNNQPSFWKFLEKTDLNFEEIEKLKKDFANKEEGDFSYSYNGTISYGYFILLDDIQCYIISEIGDEVIGEQVELVNKLALKDEVFTILCLGIMILCVYFYFRETTSEIKEANKKIDDNMNIMIAAAEHSNHIIFTYDDNLKKISVKSNIRNHLFEEETIFSVPESIISKGIIAPENIEDFKNLFINNYKNKNGEADIKIILERKELWYNIALYNTYDQKNILVETIGIISEITNIKKKEINIKRKLEVYDKLIKNAILYAKVDLKLNIIFELNGKEENINFLNFLKESIIKKVKNEHLSFIIDKFSVKNLIETLDNNKEFLEIEFAIKDGDTYKWVSCMFYRLSISDKTKVLFVINDIDQKKHKELELKRRAEQDGLTGLYNSITSKSKIEKVLSKNNLLNEKHILILIDLDNYKLINDCFGHLYGDNVLIDVSNILKRKFRSNDIIGRLGGDEFIALLTNIDPSFDVERLAVRLIEDLKSSLEITYKEKDKKVKLSSSIGYVIVPDDGVNFETLYKKADEALYQVKKSGKNSYMRYHIKE